jgi:hypothetical protein
MAQPMKERRLEGLQEHLMLERRARGVIQAMAFWVAECESRD